MTGGRIRIEGKGLVRGGVKVRVRGVTYGPFAAGTDGHPFPGSGRLEGDFALMRAGGINAIRTYHVPPGRLLEAAEEHAISVLVDVPWPKHLYFLDSAAIRSEARRLVRDAARRGREHASVLAYSIGNEIRPDVVRWHGVRRVERFLAELRDVAKQADPDGLVTYASYPPTEYLDSWPFDFATFNVYLHDREAFRRYVFRLQNLVGDRPLVLGELGMDTLRHGEVEQADFLSGHLREATLMGLAGAFIFSWTDDWHTGGHRIEDWAFGITHADRRPKAAFHAVGEAFARPPAAALAATPRVSVAVRPEGGPLAGSVNAAYFRRVTEDFGLEGRAALVAEDRETVGLDYQELIEVARRADVLFNVSGMLTDEGLIVPIPVRVYLDLDPAFVQLWHEAEGIDMRFEGHTHFATVGLALGSPGCVVPTCGLDWITTTQPVVLERWPEAGPLMHDVLTTVGNWRGYGSIEHGGVFYGQKAHSWRPLVGLPRLTPERFAPAIAIHPGEAGDLRALRENGWCLLDPSVVASTPDDYRAFIRGSKAEFGVAKGGYVASRCGWFSDRSACYLASGRPVIAQETGFSRYLPTGAGLFAFETADDVLAAIAEINGDYSRHRRAARDIAERFFDSDKVLGILLDRLAPLRGAGGS